MKKKRQSRIVMVDDDSDDIFLTRMAVRNSEMNCDFLALQSAQALFDYIDTHGIDSIDLLMLDINMPVVNGHDTLSKLKQLPRSSELNVMMFTTSRNKTDQDIAKRLGASAFAVKPATIIETAEIMQMVQSLLPQQSYALAS